MSVYFLILHKFEPGPGLHERVKVAVLKMKGMRWQLSKVKFKVVKFMAPIVYNKLVSYCN